MGHHLNDCGEIRATEDAPLMEFFDEFVESSGRLNRTGFLVHILAGIFLEIVFILAWVVFAITGNIIVLILMYSLLYFIASVIGNAIIRRLHDFDIGGWYSGPVTIFLTFLTILSMIPVIVLMIPDGQTTSNRYGKPADSWRGTKE